VTKGLAGVALLLFAIGSADAQTSAQDEGGPRAAADGGTAVDEKAEPAPQAATPPPPQDGFKVGGFTFRPGGRIKLDIIRDFNAITSEDSFDPRTIAIDGSEGANSNLHAKESRLFLDIRGPAEGKELRMYVEGDFYGTSSAFRLRHAYGSWGGLLAGQTWSTFVDDANMPNTIDFESPLAFPSLRQAQLRWTSNINDKASWSVAVEDNKSTITAPPIPGKPEYVMPDFVGRIKADYGRMHSFVAGFIGAARFRPAEGDPDTVTLWGGVVSEKYRIASKDSVYAQFTFGDGVGRYRSAITAVPDENNRLQPLGVLAVIGGYEHYWTPVLSSNGVYGVSSAPHKDYFASDLNTRLDYAAINLLYWFLPDRAWAGVEYLYGRREVFSGDNGSARRLQFAVRFNLP
jgi:hypothetical protein